MSYLPLPILTTDPPVGQAAPPTRVIFPQENMTAFGELATTQKSSILSLNFNYSINSFFTTTTTANGGTVTQSTGMAVLQTGTNTAGSARLQSRSAIRYIAGTGTYASFTALFTTGVANSIQYAGLGDSNDGVFWGYNGATFGVFERTNGVDTFIAQSSFNVDKIDGTGSSGYTLTPTNLNLYKVEFGWHGSGPIKFWTMDIQHGHWILCHVIYAFVTSPRFLNPTLPLILHAANSGNNTNLTLKCASMGAYREGKNDLQDVPLDGAPGSAGNSKTNTTELNIISIQNNTTVFSGQVNKVRVRLRGISFAANNQTLIVRAILNTTLGGTPAFTDFDTSTSVVSIDTAGTTVSGGREIWRGHLGSGGGSGNEYVDLSNQNLVISPGDVVTMSAISGGSQVVFVGVQWQELFSG